jgi:hypothetical protein
VFRRRAEGYAVNVGIGTSLFLIAAGAILKFAVTASVSGIELETVGAILMVIGILGLVIALIYPAIVSRSTGYDREIVREEPPTRRY